MSSSHSPFASFLVLVGFCTLIGCGSEATSDDVRPPGASAVADDPAAPDPDGPPATDHRPVVAFLGNSLTAGLGVSPDEAFPALIQAKIDAAGLSFRVLNAGVSGETTAGGLRRIDRLLNQSPSVLVLALGANDALRGAPAETVRSNLQQIISRTREQLPATRILIAGMLAPPNMGETYTTTFRAVFPELAAANGTGLIPFLLEGVAADPTLNQADGIHPTPAGHGIIANTVWHALEDILQAEIGETSSGTGH